MKAVIFDFNGTMVFDGPYHDLAWKMFSKEIRGYAMDDEEINRNVHGKVNRDIIKYLKPDVSDEENLRLSLEKEAMYRKMCLEDKDNYNLVEGLYSYMNFLKHKNIPFTIASASIKENIDFFIQVFHLEKWVDVSTIVYNDDTHSNKKSMFLEAAKRLNTPIEDCIIFEDSFEGVKCAKEIGCGKIIAIPLSIYREEFEKKDEVAFTIADFNDHRIREVF